MIYTSLTPLTKSETMAEWFMTRASSIMPTKREYATCSSYAQRNELWARESMANRLEVAAMWLLR